MDALFSMLNVSVGWAIAIITVIWITILTLFVMSIKSLFCAIMGKQGTAAIILSSVALGCVVLTRFIGLWPIAIGFLLLYLKHCIGKRPPLG